MFESIRKRIIQGVGSLWFPLRIMSIPVVWFGAIVTLHGLTNGVAPIVGFGRLVTDPDLTFC